MSTSNPKSELSLFETIDVRAFFETLRLRWWVIPVVLAASVGFLQAQESDLRTEPASYIVSRGYEVWSPTKALSSVGINLALVEFPEPITQLLILKSNEVSEEIAAKIGKEVEVKIPENWETPVTFTCNQPVESDCVQALDAYVAKAAQLRRDSINTGIDNRFICSRFRLHLGINGIVRLVWRRDWVVFTRLIDLNRIAIEFRLGK